MVKPSNTYTHAEIHRVIMPVIVEVVRRNVEALKLAVKTTAIDLPPSAAKKIPKKLLLDALKVNC
jgi:hypothetical protein